MILRGAATGTPASQNSNNNNGRDIIGPIGPNNTNVQPVINNFDPISFISDNLYAVLGGIAVIAGMLLIKKKK